LRWLQFLDDTVRKFLTCNLHRSEYIVIG
jgi:hypothetical protein